MYCMYVLYTIIYYCVMSPNANARCVLQRCVAFAAKNPAWRDQRPCTAKTMVPMAVLF